MRRALCLLLPAMLSGVLSAQAPDALTLADAVRLAANRNGTIRSAFFDVQSARARTDVARSAFFPVITPFVQYSSTRNVSSTFVNGHVVQTDGTSTGLSTSIPLFDTGQRQLSLLSASRSEASTRANALQTLRSTLFTVHQQYYDALRAQELLKVAQAQVDRTKLILDQTEKRVEQGDAAKKDILQAKSDYLNAQVDVISQRNATASAEAALKATIGYEQASTLPALAKPETSVSMTPESDIQSVVREGLANRADLISQRRAVDSTRFNAKLLRLQAGPTFSLDTTFDVGFSPSRSENRSLVFFLSAPLFDGGSRRAQARAARSDLSSQESLLLQSEREAQAEIETAVADFNQNADRVNAAKAALDAAQENYKAAAGAQSLGAASIIEVSAAQVSLVTAESNHIQAIYDFYTSDVRLRLAAGRPVPGETLIPQRP